jgi:hypothetical protein
MSKIDIETTSPVSFGKSIWENLTEDDPSPIILEPETGTRPEPPPRTGTHHLELGTRNQT